MAFKMKGSPFQRNFGIGGPAKLKKDDSAMKMKKDSAMDMKEPMKMKKDSPMDMKTSMKMKEAAMKMGHKSPSKMGHKSPVKAAKPDFPDIDGDGNTTESMKQAAADKKSPAKQKKQVEAYNKEVKELKEMIAKLSEPGTMAADSTGGSFTPKNLKKIQKKQKKVQKRKSKAIKKGARATTTKVENKD
tara:strand:- start:39 stop:602 length:564 start_codon:yes stop_codon:yes gene_type:complete